MISQYFTFDGSSFSRWRPIPLISFSLGESQVLCLYAHDVAKDTK
jgi:hypothetical protein